MLGFQEWMFLLHLFTFAKNIEFQPLAGIYIVYKNHDKGQFLETGLLYMNIKHRCAKDIIYNKEI